MSLDDYPQCADLEQVATLARDAIAGSGKDFVFNFCIKARFSADLLAEPQLADVTEQAELWQKTTRPEKLFFSHGEFLGPEAINHIAQELSGKPDSNRALASLISVKDIIDSGDLPLPSFLVFQCLIDGTTLYVTAMYRAMEVADFFRINLEEIRIMTRQVYEANRTVRDVALCVFVTRAYLKPGMSPLEKSELDLLSQLELVTKHRDRLPMLLRDKRRQSTYPVSTGLRHLQEIAANEDLRSDMQIPGNGPGLQALLARAVNVTERLQELRRKTSHHSDITKLDGELHTTLERLADMIDKAARGAPA